MSDIRPYTIVLLTGALCLAIGGYVTAAVIVGVGGGFLSELLYVWASGGLDADA